MKKALLSLVAVLFAITAMAQNEHLTFKGVPIDGTLDQYVAKMKKAGFTYVDQKDGGALLQGDFAGYKDCKIVVASSLNVASSLDTDVVFSIFVVFPTRNNWSLLEYDYNTLKSMLTEKYGPPSKETEEFQNGDPKKDYLRWAALYAGNCSWCSAFSNQKGFIILSMSKVKEGFATMLIYLDNINSKFIDNNIRQQAMDDL